MNKNIYTLREKNLQLITYDLPLKKLTTYHSKKTNNLYSFPFAFPIFEPYILAHTNMPYQSLRDCVIDLEKHGQLIRITEEVDPHLEMAAIHLRVFENKGPALLFENIKGSKFPAVSNLFGTLERSHFIFRDTLAQVKDLVLLKNDPIKALKHPLKNFKNGIAALSALPKKIKPFPLLETQISALPQIVNWELDGGAFITMPQVYTEDVALPGVMNANMGMYRIQYSGNEYLQNQEIGLHYQLHRGIGIHQTKANAMGKPLKVSIFVGGCPAHAVAAVMPLPEGLSELTFAGVLGGRRFRYFYDAEGFCISADADFIITGTVYPQQNKPEGPFGDHLGYYSLRHPFPLMKVHKVYHRPQAIWNFTVVGRPPQEDTQFGALIHEITGAAMPHEIPGLQAVNAVDAAGVHPLLFAIGSERYTPYLVEQKPQEILTIANHILGKNQLSLAKFLWIANTSDDPDLDIYDIEKFLTHVLSRMDFTRDLHFHTHTTMDTLDYSGTGINTGSKVVFAAAGAPKRVLTADFPSHLQFPSGVKNAKMAFKGVLVLQISAYQSDLDTQTEIQMLNDTLITQDILGIALMVLADDADFTAKNADNFVWVTFTRSNPSHDIHGIGSFTAHKHWGCTHCLVIDARKKPHHAPELLKNPTVEQHIERLGVPGASLQDWL